MSGFLCEMSPFLKIVGQQNVPAAVEDSWTKVTRNDSDFSLSIEHILTSPIKGVALALWSIF